LLGDRLRTLLFAGGPGPQFALLAKFNRSLLAELPGDREHAARVRCRLLPGLW
jgi:hypothetical protein